MSRFKQQMIMDEERGYILPPEKNVCAVMFPKLSLLREMINNRAVSGYCDYSNNYGQVVRLEEIVKKVIEYFNMVFENPAEEVPFESGGEWDELEGTGWHKEGAGYMLPDNRMIMTTEEALDFVNFETGSVQLTLDISNCFLNDAWVVKDPLLATGDERMHDLWEQFWRNTIRDARNNLAYNEIKANNQKYLEFATNSIISNRHALQKTLPKGSIIYRCVNYSVVPNPIHPSDLWAPPEQIASSQRMSRAGQSRFYASFDSETPLNEAVHNGPKEHHCLATFVLNQDVKVLDFCNLPEARLLNVLDYFAFVYFHQFANAITIKVGENEKEKYVPTQIMRDIIEANLKSMGIMGIKYRSVKGDNTSNVVLFLDNNTCANYLILEKCQIL